MKSLCKITRLYPKMYTKGQENISSLPLLWWTSVTTEIVDGERDWKRYAHNALYACFAGSKYFNSVRSVMLYWTLLYPNIRTVFVMWEFRSCIHAAPSDVQEQREISPEFLTKMLEASFAVSCLPYSTTFMFCYRLPTPSREISRITHWWNTFNVDGSFADLSLNSISPLLFHSMHMYVVLMNCNSWLLVSLCGICICVTVIMT